MVHKSKLRIEEGGRQCSRCEKFKPWSEFSRNKHGTRGYQSWCRDCFREQAGRQEKPSYLITDDGRECSQCGKFKPWNQFHVRRDLSTGRASSCKACRKKYTRENMKNGTIRNNELQRKYGITLEEYERMASSQGDACAICGTTEKGTARGRVRYWSVDHNHETGDVRALLCQKCNAFLGLANDDPTILQRGINYLKQHGE